MEPCLYCGKQIILGSKDNWYHAATPDGGYGNKSCADDLHLATPISTKIPKEEMDRLIRDFFRRKYDWNPKSADEHFTMIFDIQMEKNPESIRQLIIKYRDRLERRDEAST